MVASHRPPERPGCRELARSPGARRAPALGGPFLAVALVGALGCEGGPTAAEPTAPAPTRPPLAATVTARPAAPAASTTVVSEASWPAPDRIDRAARAALAPPARQAVDQAVVPVLVPAGTEWLAGGTVMTGAHWFAFAASGDGVTLSVQGTRLAHRRPTVSPAEGDRRVRGLPAFVGENRGIWTVSWREHGVSYALDLECAVPTDARCADEQAAVAWVDGLVFVGGRGVAPAGGAP